MSGGIVKTNGVLQIAHLVSELSAARHDDDGALRLSDALQDWFQPACLRQTATNLDDGRRLSHGQIPGPQPWWRGE